MTRKSKKVVNTITIPIALAKLLASEPSDYKDSEDFEATQEMSKILLKVLLEAK